MKKLFEHTAINHRTTEVLSASECGQGVYIGVARSQLMPLGGVDESTESIVLPLDKASELANSLASVATTWIKPSDKLPEHLQDCIVCRMVDGQCRISHSHYFNGSIVKGFGDLEDGERFYDDAEILYWMPVYMTDIYRELDKLNGVT